jgi:hypothetical protein
MALARRASKSWRRSKELVGVFKGLGFFWIEIGIGVRDESRSITGYLNNDLKKGN